MPLKIKDQEAWQRIQDKKSENPHTMLDAIVTYAESWGLLMQDKMAAGEKLEDMARSASHEADTMGMSGYAVTNARNMLIQCWEHGDALAEVFGVTIDPIAAREAEKEQKNWNKMHDSIRKKSRSLPRPK